MNTAQAIIILIAIACVGVIYNAYQKSHEKPAPPPISSTIPDPKRARYEEGMRQWQEDLAKDGLTLTWPYLGQDQIARLVLPPQQPITLEPWDDASQKAVAAKAYRKFAAIRKASKVPDSGGCIVYLCDTSGTELATVSASGIAPAQPE